MKISIISFLLFIGITFSVTAQDNSETQSNSTDSQIKQLADVVSKLPKIGGLVNTRFQYSDDGIVKNGFDVRRLYLNGTGAITKEVSYRFQVDFAGTPKILDAYVEWKPSKYIGFQTGQYKVPYTLENPYSPTNLETADNSQVVSALITDNSSNGRDVGASLNGSLFFQNGYNIIDYKLGVFNGNSINVTDNNTTKDVVGTLIVTPLKPLSFAASFYDGKYGPQTTKYKRNRSSYGVKYDDGKLLVRSEYIKGTTNTTDSYGYYASAAYYATSKLQPVLKYDYYNSDKSKESSPSTVYLVGLNYWFAKISRIQVNYSYKNFKDPSKKDSNYLTTQLLIGF